MAVSKKTNDLPAAKADVTADQIAEDPQADILAEDPAPVPYGLGDATVPRADAHDPRPDPEEQANAE